MTNYLFAQIAYHIATEVKTMYIYGGIGGALHQRNKTRALKRAENQKVARKAKIEAATDDTFGFDCVGLIKSILWGFCEDKTLNYGGATYRANDVPDIGADSMIGKCLNVSSDFTGIEVGEMVWMVGHCGIYIGNGLVVESTPIWSDGVQLSICGNIDNGNDLPVRTWLKHGRLPWIDYDMKHQYHRGEVITICPDPCSSCGREYAEIVDLDTDAGTITVKIE